MSWLATDPPLRTLRDALALRPDLLAGCRVLEAVIAAEPSLDDGMRAWCRTRVAALMGAKTGGTGESGVPPDDDVVEFVEQLVLDAQGVTDALVARLATVLSPRAIVALAQSVAVWEAEHRIARGLAVSPEL
jgi:hypothetical protein